MILFPYNYSISKSSKPRAELIHSLKTDLSKNSYNVISTNARNNNLKYYQIFNKDNGDLINVRNSIYFINLQNKTVILSFHYGNFTFYGALFFLMLPFCIIIFFFINDYKKIIISSIYPIIIFLIFINKNKIFEIAKMDFKKKINLFI